MANNYVAEMTATISIDKNQVAQSAIEALNEAQVKVNKNALTYEITGDTSQLENVLKEIGKDSAGNIEVHLSDKQFKSDLSKMSEAIKDNKIGAGLAKSIRSEISSLNLDKIIADKLGDGTTLTKDNVLKLVQELKSTISSANLESAISLYNKGDATALNSYIKNYELLATIVGKINKETADMKNIGLSKIDLSQDLLENFDSKTLANKINTIFESVDFSGFTSKLESNFQTAFENITKNLPNIQYSTGTSNGGLVGNVSGSSGGSTTSASDSLKKEVNEVNELVTDSEKLLEVVTQIRNAIVKVDDNSSIRNLIDEFDILYQKIEAITKLESNLNIKFDDLENGDYSSISDLLSKLSEENTGLNFNGLKELNKLNKLKDLNINTNNILNILSELSSFDKEFHFDGLKELNKLKNFENINLDKILDNLIKVSEIIKLISEEIRNIPSINDNDFISSINQLIEKSKDLENLATVLKASKEEIKNANKNTKQADDKKAEEEKLKGLVKQYKALVTLSGKQTLTDEENAKVDELKKSIEELQKNPNGLISKTAIQKSINDLKNIDIELKNIKRKAAEKSLSKATTSFEKISPLANKYTSRNDIDTGDLKSKFEAYKKAYQSLSNTSTAKEFEDVAKQASELTTMLDKLEAAYNKISTERASKEILNVSKFLRQNTRISKDARLSLESLQKELSNGVTPERFKAIQKEIADIESAEIQAGRAGKKFGDLIALSYKNLVRYLSTYASFYKIFDILKRGISTVIDLDTQLIDLKKTTTMSSSELDNFYLSANKTAKQMGVSTSEIISQASAWSRLGYSTAEAATQMSKLSSKFSIISPGMDTDTAQSGMVSIMKAFNIGVDQAERQILDNVNQIGNTMALSNTDIVAGLERSASAMNAANNSLEESIALLASGVEITQDAESMGAALKTISMRIRGKVLPPYTVMYMLCA